MGVTITETTNDLAHKRYIDDLDPFLWTRLVGRICKDHPDIDQAQAERIMNEATLFLVACAENPGHGLAPSSIVDIGWHTFLLYTKGYKAFCERYAAGRFIHHEPNDMPGANTAAKECDGGDCITCTTCLERTEAKAKLIRTKAECYGADCNPCGTDGDDTKMVEHTARTTYQFLLVQGYAATESLWLTDGWCNDCNDDGGGGCQDCRDAA